MIEESQYPNQKVGEFEQEKTPDKKVLKISEMALFIDGQYVGEVGNSSYGEKRDMFEYDPESGLLVSGQRETMLLTKDDLARVPHVLGHVTVERLLGDKPGQFSDREFERKLYKICSSVENKISKIIFLGQIFNIDWRSQDTDFCINRIARVNSQFSPEELIDAILNELKNKYEWQYQDDEIKKNDLARMIENLKTTEILDVNPEKNRDSIISYFYLYCQLKGIDISNSDSIYNDGFNNFRFLDELMKEYERQPDARFGDALLLACFEEKIENQEKRRT